MIAPRSLHLPNVDLVLFDCDGVLIDSEGISSVTMSASLAAFGVSLSPLEIRLRFTGGSGQDNERALVREHGLTDLDGFNAHWRAALFAAFAQDLAPINGIGTVVAALVNPVCVASNSSVHRLQRSLGLLPLAAQFDGNVFSAEMVARPKPAPDLLLHAAQRMRARPGRCVMIDDSTHGVEAAVAAGMPGIGFIEPGDPRPERRKSLLAAGAVAVAEGASGLPEALRIADRVLGGMPARAGLAQ